METLKITDCCNLALPLDENSALMDKVFDGFYEAVKGLCGLMSDEQLSEHLEKFRSIPTAKMIVRSEKSGEAQVSFTLGDDCFQSVSFVVHY